MNCKNKALITIFEFTDDEADALHGFIPMTQELYDSCMDKCMLLGSCADDIFSKLSIEYPEFLDVYLHSSNNFPF